MQKAHAERIQKVRMMQQQAQLMRQNRDVATPPPPATRQQIQPVAAPITRQQIQPVAIPPKPIAPPQKDTNRYPAGLVNLGNTCYMNSVLECLRHCGPLIRYLFGSGFQKDRVCFTNRKPAEQAFAGEFRALMNKLESSQPGQAVPPMNILRFLMLLNPVFAYRQQADAQECINTMLQVLHTALTVNVKIHNMPGVGTSDSFELQRLGNGRYAGHVKANGYSVIEELFGSQFLSKLVYDDCGHVSHTHDPYTIVPVPIPDKVHTLYDCFDFFIEPEKVENVTCDECKEQKSAVKELSFWTLPQVLVIQLKRFNHALKKIEKFVQAPITLNMSKYVTHPRVSEVIKSDPKALQLYDLKSVICHVGGLNGGHYYARCWRPEDTTEKGNWVNFDDASVSPIAEDQLQNTANYCFFYEMRNSSKHVWSK